MKKIIFLFFILSYSLIFAQEFKIPEMKFQNRSDGPNVYIELLNLKDNKSLIIKTSTSSYWHTGIVSNLIIYQNDGKILKYTLDSKFKIKRKLVKRKNYKMYWDLLNKLTLENKFEIQSDQLNITSKPDDKGNATSVQVSDGYIISIEVCKGNNYTAYGSENPDIFIKEKYPGYMERQKLVDLIQEIDNLFENF